MNETAKKILGFISRLPETWDGQPLRQQALDNFDEKFCEASPSDVNEKSFIGYAFNWNKTLEKRPYWQEIYTLIKEGTIQLLQKVEEKKEEFVWTDELALEFSVSPYATISPLRDGLEQFKASKQRKPLFVTEDGKQIFDGDEYWYVWVESDYEIIKHKAKSCTIKEDGIKDFSTEAAAKQYVRQNKPMYSLNDIEIASNKIGSNPDEIFSLKIELEKLKP